MGDRMFKVVSAVHVFVYRLTGGRFGGRMVGAPVLLLETVGRKSGKYRTTPLMYLPDGETMVLVASKGGADTHPHWWLNLRRMPETQVRVGNKTMRVKVEEASAEERARLWPMATAMFSGYAQYQQKTTREIPLTILRPMG